MMSEISFFEENGNFERLGNVKRDNFGEMDTVHVDNNRETDCLKRNRGKPYTKKTHSDIEKRRRDKMNTYINELSTMIPMCCSTSRKLDKLTVLRMAVQHMKSLRETSKPLTETKYKPAFLSDDDMKYLILDAAEGFLLVVSCDRGRILYVSDTISETVNYSQSDIVGDSFFDLVHPKDVSKIKEQLMCPETIPREQQTDSRTKTSFQTKNEVNQQPVKLCSGSRRSFYCRMKKELRLRRTKENDMEISDRSYSWKGTARPSDKMQYEIVQFSGFLKTWPSTGCGFDEDDDDSEPKNSISLVCVGRVAELYDEETDFSQPGVMKEFVSRHGVDGRYIWVDHRMTMITGWLPQDLVGRSAYEYIYNDDLASISTFHKKALLQDGPLSPIVLRFRCKRGHYLPMKSTVTVFNNPLNDEPEFIICENQILADYEPSQHLQALEASVNHRIQRAEFSPTAALSEARRLTDVDDRISVPGIERIGAMVVEEVQQRRAENSRRSGGMNGSPVDSRNMSPMRRKGQGSGTQLHSHTQSSSSSSYGDSHNNITGRPGVQSPSVDQTHNVSSGSELSGSESSSPCPKQNTAQPYLLEQLIGMQDAIESMERIAPHNEDTMSAFMNLLMSETGLADNE